MDDYFATETCTLIDIVCEIDLNKDYFLMFTFNRNI